MNIPATVMHTEKKVKKLFSDFLNNLGSVIPLFTKQILPAISEKKFLFLDNKMSNR